jgi:YafQ family addiction module toxin component
LSYEVIFSEEFAKQLKKIKKKDSQLLQRIKKKILQIKENPLHYKPLRNVLKGFRRAHVDPFVMIFEVKEKKIIFYYVKHHDYSY